MVVASKVPVSFYSFFLLKVATWIAEKNSIAQDESWTDPSNMQAKLQKHQTFHAEIIANRNRLDSIKAVREAGPV